MGTGCEGACPAHRTAAAKEMGGGRSAQARHMGRYSGPSVRDAGIRRAVGSGGMTARGHCSGPDPPPLVQSLPLSLCRAVAEGEGGGAPPAVSIVWPREYISFSPRTSVLWGVGRGWAGQTPLAPRPLGGTAWDRTLPWTRGCMRGLEGYGRWMKSVGGSGEVWSGVKGGCRGRCGGGVEGCEGVWRVAGVVWGVV